MPGAGTRPTDLQGSRDVGLFHSMLSLIVDIFVLWGGHSNGPLAANRCANGVLSNSRFSAMNVVWFMK